MSNRAAIKLVESDLEWIHELLINEARGLASSMRQLVARLERQGLRAVVNEDGEIGVAAGKVDALCGAHARLQKLLVELGGLDKPHR